MSIQQYQLLSRPPDRLLRDHLQRVASASMKTVEELLNINGISTSILHKDLIRTAFYIGACHDIGKGTPYFQQYLSGAKGDVFLKSHAMISALYCSWLIRYDKAISDTNRKFLALAASLVIQGHHGSLKSRGKYTTNLDYFNENKIFAKQVESYKVNQQEMEMITTSDLGLNSFIEFCKEWEDHLFYFSNKVLAKPIFEDEMEPYFLINMLFSALLDSDNMDAAELERPGRLELDHDIIKTYISGNLKETTEIDRLRNALFKHVNDYPIDLNVKRYTLTADTGLGKTLTSMNLALRIRKQIEQQKGYKPRIIYVAPFISILDQNMEVLQKVFTQGKESNTNLLLIHHHLANARYHDDIKHEDYATFQSEFLTHGWNAEIIVATFIQFFTMVFGRFTSQLRRLDNIIGSIVILDEVQSIPFDLWDIVREGLLYLSNKFNFTIILMTATQPLIFRKGETVEIADSIHLPNRVTFELRNDEQITLYNFCLEMHELVSQNKHKNIMIELNTVYTANEVFDSLSTINTHNVRFLSSQVIPKHRRPRINEIKSSLVDNNDDKPIVLVTTQVVEAGVDLDFDIAVRDIGPIDSIVQAAGRCNREFHKKAEDSLFYVYRIVDDRHKIPREHARYVYDDVAIEIANSMLNTNNINIEELVQQYYTEVRRRQSNQKSNEIYDFISDLDYESVERQCRLLDEDLYKLPLFVEFDQDAIEIWEKYLALSKVENNNKARRTSESIQLRNEMGQYMIDVNQHQVYLANLKDVGGIFKIDNSNIGRLYDKEKGFVSLS
jgi:CRISPR-associated endonuclease/helicase Cas3